MTLPRYDEIFAPDGTTLLEQLVDNGDGTGTRTTYDADGNATVEQLEGLPTTIPDPTDEASILDAAETARRAAYDAVMAAGTRSMARLEEADRAGSDAFRAVLAAAQAP